MSQYPYGQLPAGWETQVLAGIQAPITSANIALLDAWTAIEQGVPARAARYNPFNTTLAEPGATAFNANGGYPVLNYPDWATGLRATVQTLTGSFPSIVSALRAGNATPATIYTTNWGTGAFGLRSDIGPSTSYGGAVSPLCGIPLLGGATCGALGAAGNAASGVGSTISGIGNLPGDLGSIPGDVASGIAGQAESALGWIGQHLVKWLILAAIAAAALILLDQLLTHGEGAQMAKRGAMLAAA